MIKQHKSLMKQILMNHYGCPFEELPADANYLYLYKDMDNIVRTAAKVSNGFPFHYQGISCSKEKNGIRIQKQENMLSVTLSPEMLTMQANGNLMCQAGVFYSPNIEIRNMSGAWKFLNGSVLFGENQKLEDYASLKDCQFFYVSDNRHGLFDSLPSVSGGKLYPVSEAGFFQAVQYMQAFNVHTMYLNLFTIADGDIFLNHLYQLERNQKYFQKLSECVEQWHLAFGYKLPYSAVRSEEQFQIEYHRKIVRSCSETVQQLLDDHIEEIKTHPQYPYACENTGNIYTGNYSQGIIPYAVKVDWHDIPAEKQAMAFRYLNTMIPRKTVSECFVFIKNDIS